MAPALNRFSGMGGGGLALGLGRPSLFGVNGLLAGATEEESCSNFFLASLTDRVEAS